ncbi:hypothetical protein ABH917_001064 [Thermobifida halotolerans]
MADHAGFPLDGDTPAARFDGLGPGQGSRGSRARRPAGRRILGGQPGGGRVQLSRAAVGVSSRPVPAGSGPPTRVSGVRARCRRPRNRRCGSGPRCAWTTPTVGASRRSSRPRSLGLAGFGPSPTGSRPRPDLESPRSRTRNSRAGHGRGPRPHGQGAPLREPAGKGRDSTNGHGVYDRIPGTLSAPGQHSAVHPPPAAATHHYAKERGPDGSEEPRAAAVLEQTRGTGQGLFAAVRRRVG